MGGILQVACVSEHCHSPYMHGEMQSDSRAGEFLVHYAYIICHILAPFTVCVLLHVTISLVRSLDHPSRTSTHPRHPTERTPFLALASPNMLAGVALEGVIGSFSPDGEHLSIVTPDGRIQLIASGTGRSPSFAATFAARYISPHATRTPTYEHNIHTFGLDTLVCSIYTHTCLHVPSFRPLPPLPDDPTRPPPDSSPLGSQTAAPSPSISSPARTEPITTSPISVYPPPGVPPASYPEKNPPDAGKKH